MMKQLAYIFHSDISPKYPVFNAFHSLRAYKKPSDYGKR